MVVIEEAGYMSQETFLEIIAPLMVMDHTCMVAISTLNRQRTGFFTRLIHEGLFKVHRSMYVCQACIDKGIRTKCVHRLDAIPHWNSDAKLDMIRNMIGEENRATFELENLGLDPEDSESGPEVFSAPSVNALFTSPRVELSSPIRTIFVVVDPVAGSDVGEGQHKSDFVILSLGAPGSVILGLDAIDVKDHHDYMPQLIRHIERLCKLKYCQDALIVLDVESGTGLEVGHIHETVQHVLIAHGMQGRLRVVTDFKRKMGSRTSNEAKAEMALLSRLLLNAGEVMIAKDFVTSHPDVAKLFGEFRDQMLRFARTIVPGSRQNTVIYSGKGKHNTMRDDMALTLMRAIRARHRYLYSSSSAGRLATLPLPKSMDPLAGTGLAQVRMTAQQMHYVKRMRTME